MNEKYLVGLSLLVCAGAAHAQYLGPISAPCVVGSNLSCAPVTAANPLPTTSAGGATAGNQTATGANAQTVQGNVASGATDAGNPVGIGGYASSATPTAVPAGSRVKAWYTLNGAGVFTTPGIAVSSFGTYGAASLAIPMQADGGSRPYASGMLVYNNVSGNAELPVKDGNGLWTVAKGGSNIATGQVSVGMTATLIAAGRAGRQRITVSKQAATNCAYGGPAVTLTTGYIPDNSAAPAAGMSFARDTAAPFYGVCAAATNHTFVEDF
ncbi:MAG: hypothetical protein ACRYGI_11430 [Janthinobacterium lividum]